ncbi:MAG: hypothetical protein ACFFDN_33875 [Candidatus Hodarchaeota archaeon]
MWFDSKYRIRRKTESYPSVKNALKTPQKFNPIIPISNLKKAMSHMINGLNEIPSISYPEMKKVIIGIIKDILEALNFIGCVTICQKIYIEIFPICNTRHEIFSKNS